MADQLVVNLEAAIRDVLVRIQRQRDFIDEFSARGYDVKAAHTLLSCLITNLKRLERQRREEACQKDIAIASTVADRIRSSSDQGIGK